MYSASLTVANTLTPAAESTHISYAVHVAVILYLSMRVWSMQILRFYQHMGMALPEKPPLMLVETSALNAAEEKEGRAGSGHDHGPVFHTRGLTLTVEYKYIQHVTTRGGRQITQPMDLSARNRYEVGHTTSSTLQCASVAAC